MIATTTIPLEGIITFLDSMTLSTQNKRWLGEHLIEQANQEQSQIEATREHARILKGMNDAFKEVRLARDGKLQGRPLTEVLNEI